MEHYLTLRIVHGATAVLLLLGVIVHLLMLWKAARGGDQAVLQRKLQRTRRLSLPLLALIGLSLPLTGWWMAHLAGWPLGQVWLLASSVLFVVLVALVPLLAGRLAAWQAPGNATAARNAGIYGVLVLLVLIAITALMGAKPV
ncbi:DUF2269 family protein [Stutzerimonas stutzeri]|uniref:DUF2269 domain-containing protein n=1 Tax=Stutzerimonas stutzeri TaxID=316 RepID=A0AA40RPH9_STUST|nr:DUF2269 family protein [Stutzerimonas stutzeri]MBA1303090.1 DUF2269 domain-containing protein [Stutzerimonas stutzeri]MCP3431514.1 DUF2269 domain-containing protein [Stutzerimonas stutzeri]RRV60197.1 DUF2269 domain-containing protein [Stutzerimonas stutzeri]RRV81924.1 DUF2269 domain-containing protein [Stutzerimonas stutzeri]RRW20652.1 DUF2269 domain-containing protein [Stutzerimonas stutzeri]